MVTKRERAKSLSEEQTRLLFSWIDAGQRHQARFFEEIDRWRDRLRGRGVNEKWSDAATRKDPLLVVNLAYAHVRTMVPTVFAQSPYITLKAPQEFYIPRVPATQAAVNMVLPRARFKQEGKACILDAAVLKEGWTKWIWLPQETEADEAPQPQRASGSTEAELELLLSALSGEATAGGPPPQARRNEGSQLLRSSMPELGPNVPVWPKRGGPAVLRVAPTSIVVDPLVPTRDPLLARFIAIRYRRPLSELRADPAYTIPSEDEIDFGSSLGGERGGPRWRVREAIDNLGDVSTFLPEGVRLMTIWEVWAQDLVDLKLFRQMTTLMEGAKRPIREPIGWEEFIGKHGGYPVKRITFNPIPDGFPMNELESWGDLADTVSWATSKTATNVKRFARLYWANKNKLSSDKEADKLHSAKDGATVFVTDDNAVGPIQTPQNAADTYALLQFLDTMIQKISGVSDARRGESGARTATEVVTIESGSKVRDNEKADVVNDFIIENVELLLSMMQRHVRSDFVAPASVAGAGDTFHRFGPDSFDFEPMVEVRPDSTRFANEQRELAKWQAVLTTALQLVQLALPIRVDIIAAKFFTALGVDQVPEIMGSIQLNPEGEQLVEVMEMLAGIPTPVEPGDDHRGHAETMAKIKAAPWFPMLLRNAQATSPLTGQPVNAFFMQMFEAHELDHLSAIEEMAAGAAGNQSKLQSTAFDQGNIPANQARGARPEGPDTAGEQRAVPGASNQMAV